MAGEVALRETEERIDRVVNRLLVSQARQDQPHLKATLAARMDHYKTPAVSIAVIQDYRIDWARAFGVRDAATGEPATTQTLFQAGSISKPVAAVAAMRLVQEGRLDLDGDVNDYLISWKVPPCGDWQPRITLRHLLSHSAGLTVHGFPGYPVDLPIPTLVEVLDGAGPANTPPIRVNAVPGTQFRYSGGGTSVVQQMLIDVLHKPFPQIMRELVLDPLGMAHSTYEQPLPPERARSAATGYRSGGKPVYGKWHVYPEMAAAGLWTTPSDLARFAIEMQLSLEGRSNKVLSAESVREMLNPQVEDPMGIGFFLSGKSPSTRFGHGGADEGFHADLVAYSAGGCGAVVMKNAEGAWELLPEVERSIAAEYGWPNFLPQPRVSATAEAQAWEALAGDYDLRPGFRFAVGVGSDFLSVQPTGQAVIPFFPASATTFFARVVEAELEFRQGEADRTTELVFRQNGREMTARRVSEA